MTPKGLLVIDAHAMAYRAYFAMQHQNLTNPVTGQPTAAIYGFFRMLFKVITDYNPKYTAVVWDAPGKTFRDKIYDQYKATRNPMPDDLRGQIEEMKEISVKCGFKNLEQKGFEADDIIGSLAHKFGKKIDVILLSGDKDCYQLLNKRVKMLRGKKGVTEFIEIDPTWVETELGITCKQVIDYMAIVGDSSDNVPGAKGVGPKGASKLLQEYNTLDGIYKNIEKVTAKAMKAKLIDCKEDVYLSKELVTMDLEMELVLKLEEEKLLTPDYLSDDVLMLFRNDGYNAIYAELGRMKKKAGGDVPTATDTEEAKKSSGKYELVDTLAKLKALAKKMEAVPLMAVDTETDSEQPMRANLVGISVSWQKNKGYYIALPPEGSDYHEKGIPLEEATPILKKTLEKAAIKKVGQNIKYDYMVLRRHGIELKGIVFDTMIASYLCNPNVRRHNMDDMALDLLGHDTIKYEEVVGSGRKKVTMAEIEPEKITDYAGEDADITLQLYKVLEKKVKKEKLVKVNENIEIPLIPVLADMEAAGVAIDEKYFAKLAKEYARKISSLEKSIFKAATYEFNVNSTKELQKLLFEDLGLPKGKKTKTGYSTDQSVLEGLKGLHPVVDNLLEFRKYGKLKSTYVDTLPLLIHAETGRIHTSFNQTIAATGRLSSMEPNLQNIPIREDSGRAIRRGFIPRTGNELLSLDYSQIELRIMAHYSKDKALMDAFIKEHLDVHTQTAASIFGVAEDKVDPDMRSQAKAVNFSIIYGVTEFGLSKNLRIPREAAKEYIQRFFEKYPGVQKYMDDTVKFAEENGFVKTLTGRIRQIPEINSSNHFRKEGAQRTAINTPVQGSSADIIKMAMLEIHKDMQKKKLESSMILQVHDELLFDVVPAEKDVILEIAKSRMENAMKLKIPLEVDYRFGQNWDEAH